VNADQAADLRAAYLLAFDGFSTDPSDVAQEFGHQVRYARELLGTLVSAQLLTVTNVNGEYDAWQVNDPGTYDHATRMEAEAVIDGWLNSHTEEQEMTTKTAAKPATKPAAKDKNPADLPICKCGCGNPTSTRKSLYLPGHDARHAGQVGREFIAQGKVDPQLLATLPSDKLQDKATRMLEVWFDKEEAKVRKAEAAAEVKAEAAAAKATKATPKPKAPARKKA
jgi:hypothetical protein